MTFLSLLGAQYYFRLTSKMHSLLLSGIILLFINQNFISSLGFQLSFLASFGLLYFQFPQVKLESSSNKIISKSINTVKSSFLTSFSAQIFLYPLMIQSFSELNLLSFIANLIFLPLFDILLFLTFSFWLSFPLFKIHFPFPTGFISYLIHKVIDIILFLAEKVQNYDFLNQKIIDNKSQVLALFFCCYLIIFLKQFQQKRLHRQKYKYRIIK